jgi:protein phosphatase
MLELRWGAATHQGLVRDMNEDAYAAEPGLFVVADGMGGHSAGEVASAIAVDTLRRAAGDGYRRADDVSVAVRLANASIRAEAGARSDRAGMGTTITALVVLDPEQHLLALANVGDSRTYRLRAGRLSRLTVDHSYVEELVREGQITAEEARLHPRRNIVTRALGIDPAVEVDTWTITAATGDRYVLCSDGLVDEVPDHEIDDLLSGVADPQEAAEQLVAMANRHGGRDNVTVVVVDVLQGADPATLADDDPGEPRWAEGAPEPERWADDATELLAPAGSARAADEATQVLPATAYPLSPDAEQVLANRASRRTVGVGAFLFWFAIAAIATVVVVVALVALRDGDEAPPATTLPATTVERATTTSRPGSPTSTRPPATASLPPPATTSP